MGRRGHPFVLVLALGCGQRTEPQSELSNGVEPVSSEPVPSEPVPTEPAPTEPAPTEVPRLTVAAVRDGPMRLMDDGSSALLVDTDAWTLTDAGPVPPTTIVDASQVKTPRSATLEVQDYVESPSGDAFLLTFLVDLHSGWMDGRVHQRVDGSWVDFGALGNAGVASFQHSLLVRDGAVLGLWEHRLRRNESGQHVLAAKLPATRGFTKLAGPEQVEVPRVPEGIELDEAVVGSDGTIYALTKSEEEEAMQLLIWPPAKLESERVVLPDADDLDARLSVDGEEVWVSGFGLYLARGRGHTWTRVPVERDDDHGFITDALETPDGAVWLSVADPEYGLLYRPPGGTDWIRVPVPHPWAATAPNTANTAERWWAFDPNHGWFVASMTETDEVIMWISELTWASGRVWIEVQAVPLGDMYMYFEPRSLLLTVGDLGRPVVEIPSRNERRFEAWRAEGAKVCGARRHDFVWVVLGGGDPPISLDEGQIDALRELNREDEGPLVSRFVGELDGRRALIVQADFEDLRDAPAWVERLGKRLNVPAEIDCRPWRAVEADPAW
jgi:hypothetical protein